MFTLPVPIATWVGVQNDPSATWVTTSWDVFNWNTAGAAVFDPFPYTQTQSVLRRYRTRLASPGGLCRRLSALCTLPGSIPKRA